MSLTGAQVSANQGLIVALSPAPARSIDDVVGIMQAIDGALADADGLKWFNLLYLTVTRAVLASTTARDFEDAAWIGRLDVVFANLYFAAAAGSVARGPVPAAWRPLFASRFTAGIARIQFALAGMNAHINHDLPIALVQTHGELRTVPDRASPHYRDYRHVDAILAAVETQVKPILLSGVIRKLDGSLGNLDDVIAMWDMSKAREAAWANSATLWHLDGVPPVRAAFLDALDAKTGMAGRGLLIRTQL